MRRFDDPVRGGWGPRRNIAIPFCVEKRMVGLRDGETSLRIRLLVLTESTNVSDRRTDGETLHDDIGRTYG